MLMIVGQQQAAKDSCNASRTFEALSLSKPLRGSSQALVSLQRRQKGDLLCVFGSGSDYLVSEHVTGSEALRLLRELTRLVRRAGAEGGC